MDFIVQLALSHTTKFTLAHNKIAVAIFHLSCGNIWAQSSQSSAVWSSRLGAESLILERAPPFNQQ